jgi:hypothetical protein
LPSNQGELTKEALIADKRAFVFASGINPFWELDKRSGTYHWRIRPVWRNAGDTPTRRLRLYTDCEIRNSSLPENFRFVDGAIPAGAGLLGPRQESMGGAAPLLPGVGITPQDIADAIALRKFIYLWGWVKYFDVFPGTPEHITRFCWQIIPQGDALAFIPGQLPNTPDALSFAYLHMVNGNYADEERDQL